jgi:ABC-type uncharacterized transport system permease subunit
MWRDDHSTRHGFAEFVRVQEGNKSYYRKERMMSAWLNVALVGVKFGCSVVLFAQALEASHLVTALLTGSLGVVAPAWLIAGHILPD